MNILMMTNTYLPHVGGVARSVEAFKCAYQDQGHRVLIVAPEFEGLPVHEEDVIRVPAIQRFNGSDFSVALQMPATLSAAVERFNADLVHSHHPFLLGMAALRVAHKNDLPLVYTNHTMYERYTHYVPGDSPAMQRFVIELTVRYANMSDHVFAPSASLIKILRKRGVTQPITELPTGVNLSSFAEGSGSGFKAAMDIPVDAFLVGHVGRLAPEKNLTFLATAISEFLSRQSNAHFLVVGDGPLRKEIINIFGEKGVGGRLHFSGSLNQPLLASAYQAMDVFAFASGSETQGMVLTEAMAAGVPVVAIDAPGVREVVEDRLNGRLLASESLEDFIDALDWVAALEGRSIVELNAAARRTAAQFSMPIVASRALSIYESLCLQNHLERDADFTQLAQLRRLIEAEFDILVGMAGAAGAALGGDTAGT
ncbi:MAG: 1,2-diacylglycerol 3-alpha-glucosyltransferase [Gammaproteobacteria bacterium]|jgi:1,2-diacylglycerol 3-alpha-glucosyltransferase